MDDMSEPPAASAGAGRVMAERVMAEKAGGIILDFLRTRLMARDFCIAGICTIIGELFNPSRDTIKVDRMGAIVARHRA